MTVACFVRYMKYLYPYECSTLKLSSPSELQCAIDGNRRDTTRRPSIGHYTSMVEPEGGFYSNSTSPKSNCSSPTLKRASSPTVNYPVVGRRLSTQNEVNWKTLSNLWRSKPCLKIDSYCKVIARSTLQDHSRYNVDLPQVSRLSTRGPPGLYRTYTATIYMAEGFPDDRPHSSSVCFSHTPPPQWGRVMGRVSVLSMLVGAYCRFCNATATPLENVG